ncbi:unnamed protein product [Linum trigynum]|uniref:Reverse transcriptase/retrotransposon-derived protein RNase H-like domain-containing protein n=1 Tax=Linum trigynum TaxID=586398 RepID=A0AAV2GBX4_9ROSI
MATLSCFIPHSVDKCSPFFQVLKKSAARFKWNEECNEAFLCLKDQLSAPSVLSSPLNGERLFMYLVVSQQAVSSILVRRSIDDGRDQLVYYVSKTLLPAETRYLVVEKEILTVAKTARKLRPYFQGGRDTPSPSCPTCRSRRYFTEWTSQGE